MSKVRFMSRNIDYTEGMHNLKNENKNMYKNIASIMWHEFKSIAQKATQTISQIDQKQ